MVFYRAAAIIEPIMGKQLSEPTKALLVGQSSKALIRIDLRRSEGGQPDAHFIYASRHAHTAEIGRVLELVGRWIRDRTHAAQGNVIHI